MNRHKVFLLIEESLSITKAKERKNILKTETLRCGDILSKCLTLARVLPLPSHNWDSGASEWYLCFFITNYD